MTEAKRVSEYSLRNALNKLGEICKIIAENHDKIRTRNPEVDKELLIKLAESFPKLADLFFEVISLWSDSKLKGPDAFQKSDDLEERIDIRLYETGKLDFGQMKKIMARLSRFDDAMLMEEIITPYLKQYAYLCKEKKLYKALDLCNSFETNFVEVFRKHITNESKRLENQVERCNLYYQAKLNTTTLKIAFGALAASVLSVLISIILRWA